MSVPTENRAAATAERPAPVHDRARRPRHPLPPRPLLPWRRAAADRHPRLAGLDHRAAEAHRAPHRPHRPPRQRGRRLRSGDPLPARSPVLGQADHHRLGPDPDHARLGRAHGAPGLPPVRGPGRRPATARPVGGGTNRLCAAGQLLRHHLAYATIMATRPRPCTGWPTPRSTWPPSCSTTATGPASPACQGCPGGDARERPHPRRPARPHHPVLADQHRVSAARLSWENTADFFDAKAITIPFAISVFPDEPYQAPRSWAERPYPNNLIPYHRLDRGGHFAAWEQPQLLTQDLRTALRPLR